MRREILDRYLSVRASTRIVARLDEIAHRQGMSRNRVVMTALREYVDSQNVRHQVANPQPSVETTVNAK